MRGKYGANMTISWDDFLQVDIRVGEIVKVEDFPKLESQLIRFQ